MTKKTEDEVIHYSTSTFLKDIVSYISPYRSRFIVASLLRLSGDIVNLYPVFALASVVTFFSNYTVGAPLTYFWTVLILWSAASLWRNISVYSGKNIAYQISEQAGLDAQLKAFKHLFSLDIVWHEKENAGNKLKKIQRAGSGLDRIIRMWINNYISIAVNFVGILFILGKSDIVLVLILLFFLSTYFILSFSLTRKAYNVVREVNVKEEEMNGLVFQAINNIHSVKVLDISEKLYTMIGRQSVALFSRIKERIFRFQFRGSLLSVWSMLFRFGSLGFIAYGIFQGSTDVGFLILFNGYFSRILESVNELSDTTQDLIINKFALARLSSILDEPVRIDLEEGKVDLPQDWKKITVKNVSFSYGDNRVLKNISFEIHRGERIGVIGLSGAGKSTLFKLLLKESEDFDGDILFDDLSIRNIKKSSYFEQVGVVLQETEVFNFTLRKNITIASSKEKTEDELIHTLDVAHVSDYLYKMPQGIDTFIGEKGVRLSGGEKQRLGIARAIYKQPQLLFLDEATSHLDLESEEKIQDSLKVFLQKVTAIVVAHRLTTIRELDKILVLERGELVEYGSFDDLYQKKGRFYELWEKQHIGEVSKIQ